MSVAGFVPSVLQLTVSKSPIFFFACLCVRLFSTCLRALVYTLHTRVCKRVQTMFSLRALCCPFYSPLFVGVLLSSVTSKQSPFLQLSKFLLLLRVLIDDLTELFTTTTDLLIFSCTFFERRFLVAYRYWFLKGRA